MSKKTQKAIAIFLLITMCMGLAVTPAFAKIEYVNEKGLNNIWYGDELTVDVKAGEDAYKFLSVYRDPRNSYEMSNHMVSSDGGVHNSIPQTLIMVDASKDYTWSPDGLYSLAASNYEVMYCCDEHTGYNDGFYYRRSNLEDSCYYDKTAAAHIRAIVTNSYPYVSVEQMKKNLKAEGFESADDLTRAEIITAVQMAIWNYANNAKELAYSQTFDVPTNSQWGTVLHDYTNEMDVWWKSGKRKFSKDEVVEARINALATHLKNQTAMYADKNQIVVSKLEVVDAIPVLNQDGVYEVVMRVVLNNSGSSVSDDINLEIFVGDERVKYQDITLGTETYDFVVSAANGQTIKAVVSGTQVLPKGVYFYDPKGGREVSQSLVGVAAGETPVYAEESVTLDVKDSVHADLTLVKTDDDKNPLTGAEFALYVKGEKDSIRVKNYGVDANGELKIEGLLPGEYRLRETKAPEGYARLNQAIVFKVVEVEVGDEKKAELVLGENKPAGVKLIPATEDNNVNTLTIVNKPVVPNEGDIIVEKAVSGNKAPNEPFNFTLFLTEQKVSPYADEMEAAYDDLEYVIDNMDSAVKVTTGSVYTIDGTTLSQYVFTLDGKVSMASTSGSALGLELSPFEGSSNLGDFLDAIKQELLKAYDSLKAMLQGLLANVDTDEMTVVIEQETLEAVLEAGQLFNDAKEKDAKWQLENATASALQITIGDTVYTPEYDEDHGYWEVDFQVAPGEENAVNIHVESTTGSIISYTITENVTNNGYYIGTDILDSEGAIIERGVSTGERTLNSNDDYGSYVFLNKYKSSSGGWYEYEEKDPVPPVIEEEIEDPEVPLGDIEVPEEPVIEPGMEEELEDPEVPLGDAPATGDSANAVPFMALLAAAIGGLAITRRKFN